MNPAHWPALDGCYEYFRNGECAPVEEVWRCESAAGGCWVINSERRAPDLVLSAVAELSGGAIRRSELTWSADDAPPLRLSCERVDKGFATKRRDGDEAPEAELIQAEAAFFPLLRVFTGSVFEFLSVTGTGLVIVPAIDTPTERAGLLRPRISERRLNDLGKGVLEINSKEWACRRYEYRGDQYGPGTSFWLGAGGLLLGYTWRQGDDLWDVRCRPSVPTQQAL